MFTLCKISTSNTFGSKVLVTSMNSSKDLHLTLNYIVAVLRSRTFSLKINVACIF